MITHWYCHFVFYQIFGPVPKYGPYFYKSVFVNLKDCFKELLDCCKEVFD